jgi:microcompartment protein CcmL/EutN
MTEPALALLEFSSIAAGIEAGDAMVKRAPINRIHAGTVQPGHYLVMVSGEVADVEEAVNAGEEVGGHCLLDKVFLPNVHPDVVTGLAGEGVPPEQEALGVVETKTVAAAIEAADAGLKGASVALVQLRLADGLGGKGLTLFTGIVADVEAAVEIAVRRAHNQLVRQVIISQLHAEMAENVAHHRRFGGPMEWET